MKARFLIVLVAFVPGCAVGPNFSRPEPPKVSGYTATPLPANLVTGQDIPGEWWTLFHSRPLDNLIERALKANPDLKAAQAALAVARENVLAQRGAYYPLIDASASASRNKTSAQISPTPNSGALYYSLYTPQVSVSYVPDVFGLNRRTVESLRAQAEGQRFALVATQVTLTSNVVAAAIQEASLRSQIDATRELIASSTETVQILRNQLARGYIGRLDVAAQESQLAQIQATLPPLLKQLAQERDLISALSGSYPSEARPDTFNLSSLQLPGQLPLSLPANLVDQRPDVRQAEENLHAASAQIGVAVANRLPNVTLTANLGSAALSTGSLFTGDASFWTLAAGATQPILHGGTLSHRERAARAAFEQAADQYRSTVLTAFQNVADALQALQQDADALQAASAAKDAATVTQELAKKQFQAGYANYLALLSAEQAYQQASINLVQARANRYTDTTALFQALGGGWWNRPELR